MYKMQLTYMRYILRKHFFSNRIIYCGRLFHAVGLPADTLATEKASEPIRVLNELHLEPNLNYNCIKISIYRQCKNI